MRGLVLDHVRVVREEEVHLATETADGVAILRHAGRPVLDDHQPVLRPGREVARHVRRFAQRVEAREAQAQAIVRGARRREGLPVEAETVVRSRDAAAIGLFPDARDERAAREPNLAQLELALLGRTCDRGDRDQGNQHRRRDEAEHGTLLRIAPEPPSLGLARPERSRLVQRPRRVAHWRSWRPFSALQDMRSALPIILTTAVATAFLTAFVLELFAGGAGPDRAVSSVVAEAPFRSPPPGAAPEPERLDSPDWEARFDALSRRLAALEQREGAADAPAARRAVRETSLGDRAALRELIVETIAQEREEHRARAAAQAEREARDSRAADIRLSLRQEGLELSDWEMERLMELVAEQERSREEILARVDPATSSLEAVEAELTALQDTLELRIREELGPTVARHLFGD